MKHADSAQVASLFGTIGGFVLANYAEAAATLCALLGAAYTIWKWRREIRKAHRENQPLD